MVAFKFWGNRTYQKAAEEAGPGIQKRSGVEFLRERGGLAIRSEWMA